MTPRRRWAAGLLVVLVLAPAIVRAAPVHSFVQLSTVLKAGDLVEITDASGRHLRGRVSEVTRCSIVIAPAGTNRATFRIDEVTTIRRLRAARAGGIAAAARTCDRGDCPPLTHVVAGLAGVAHGFGAVFNRPKTVYRAPKPLVVANAANCGR